MIIVTGADSGIGFEAARCLCEGGNDVILACRDKARGEAAVQRIKDSNPSALATFMELDLSLSYSIKNFVDLFLSKKHKLHVLVNNAAMKLPARDRTPKATGERVEVTMATNYIGPFLLTTRLLDTLVAAGHMTGDARIVNVTCADHDHERLHSDGAGPLDVKNFQLQKEGTFNGLHAYKNSKLCNILFTYHLAAKLQGTDVTVNAVDPGVCYQTRLERHTGKFARMCRLALFHYACRCVKATSGAKKAGQLVANLASSDHFKEKTGKYFEPDGKEGRSSVESYDLELQREVWGLSEKLANIKSGNDGFDDISLQSRV